MNYEVRLLTPRRRSTRKLPGRLNMLISAFNNLIEIRDLHFGDSRIHDLRDIDVFLQTDQTQSLPRKLGLRKALIIYDIIPYALEWDYLWSYKTARRIYGYPRKAAFRCTVRRWLYAYKIKVNSHKADTLLSISDQTKKDFVDLLRVPSKKIVVTPLGVTTPKSNEINDTDIRFKRFKETVWGYIKQPINLSQYGPFVLFIGGADKRRKLEDLVTAFNNIRSQGYKLNLVLAGDSMQGPANISTEEIQYALKTSSYKDDIIFLGFVNDAERDWLYKNAVAFIFPSRYEGFGLPILEAMIHKCPVISYKNKATQEVAGDKIIYVGNSLEIEQSIIEVLGMDENKKKEVVNAAFEHAKKYSWEKTSSTIMDKLSI